MYLKISRNISKIIGVGFAASVALFLIPGNSIWNVSDLGPQSSFATEGGDGGDPDISETRTKPRIKRTSRPRAEGSERTRLSDPDTDAVVSDINSIVAECSSLPSEYRADCIAQNLIEASKVVNKAGYSDVNKQLKSAGKKISREVSRNIDRSKPTIKSNGKTYRAVKKSAVAKVNRAATKIVKSTAKKLIRSAGNSAVKKVHYKRIAKAVDNTKVLLRSA